MKNTTSDRTTALQRNAPRWIPLALALCLGVGGSLAAGAAPARPLAPGDIVQVFVFQEPDLTVKVRVASDGRLPLPLVGDIAVGGDEPAAAAAKIRALYADGYLVNPQVSVTVIAYAKQRITVLGQVQRPGAYNMPEGEELTLLEAVGLAGGFTRLANPKRVVLKRVVAGRERVFEIDAKGIARKGDAPDIRLVPGDVLTIPESLF